jgi:hypothetical protein
MTLLGSLARPIVIGAALLLASCQPMPHPFETPDKGYNPLLDLKEPRGVTVLPVTGVPPTFGERLSAALAGALRDAEIPAAVEVGNRGSFVVTGKAGRIAADPREAELEIEWTVTDPSGKRLDSFLLRTRVPTGALEEDSAGPAPSQLTELAGRGAAKIVAVVRDDMPTAAPTAIALGTIDGAPGDGATSLKRALEFVLRQSDIPVAGSDRANALTLIGSVELGRPADGRQKVAIRWVLLLPDGSEIGAVRQENAVPAGSLDRTWGTTALLVAEAAYDGIVALYEKVPAILAH